MDLVEKDLTIRTGLFNPVAICQVATYGKFLWQNRYNWGGNLWKYEITIEIKSLSDYLSICNIFFTQSDFIVAKSIKNGGKSLNFATFSILRSEMNAIVKFSY